MSELVTSRWLAVADVLGEAHVDRDEGVDDVDCEEVLDEVQSRTRQSRVYGFCYEI